MPTSAADPLLDIAGLYAGYGKIGVLQGVDRRVGRAEIVALLGPNGAGKTTLLRAVSGLLPTTAGTVTFSGRNMRDAGPPAAVRAGLAHVIEGTASSRSSPSSTTSCLPPTICRAASAGRAWTRRSAYFPRLPPSDMTAAARSAADSSKCSPSQRAWCAARAS